MLQIVTEFCLLHLTASHAGCKYFFLSSKVHAENFSRRYMCVYIATAVDFSIQVQMNQWKIVWLPVWMNLMLLLEVVLSLVRVGRLDQNSGFHGNRKPPLTYHGENDVSTFPRLFLIRSF